MNILFLNPPFKNECGKFSREQRSPAITKSGTFYYPMWLCYAAAVLEEAGHHCLVIDAPAEHLAYDQIIREIGAFRPNVAVIDTSTPSIYDDIATAVDIKNEYDCYTVLVGTHPSALPQESLEVDSGVDAVAVGEYEYTVLELAQALEANEGLPDIEDLRQIDGLVFRYNDAIISNRHRKLKEDIDAIPFVSKMYKKHLNYKDYFYSHSQHPIVTIITSRGCPYRCVYCVYPQVFNGNRVRYRSIDNVVNEIEYILAEFPDVKEIMFEDDTLTVNRDRCREFAEEIMNRGLKFKWSANSRADIDYETMKLLKKAGARLFCVGVESGNQTVLNNIRKKLTVEKIERFFKDAKKAGILIHGCFMVGNPGETKQTLRQTLDFAKKLNPDTAQFFPVMAYPGTQIYNWALSNNYLKETDFRKWLTDDGLHNCVISTNELSSKELVSFCNLARTEFYLRPGYIFRKLLTGLTDLHELKRLSIGAGHLIKHLLKGSHV